MKIAVLYICTGKYNQFFEGFYKSAEHFFLPNTDKEYFVFTDDMKLSEASNVHLVYKKCEGFPKDSLFRFKMFLGIKDQLAKFDYIFFFNSNSQFLQTIRPGEILPSNSGSGLVAAYWPRRHGLLNTPPYYPYERNKQSKAYIPPFKGDYHYYMGGLNGGTSRAFLRMIEICGKNIQDDYDRGIIACVHDESHINHYFREFVPEIVLRNEYCWPEEWSADFNPKMVFRDKVRLDISFKKKPVSKMARIWRVILRTKKAIQWYF